MRVKLFRKGRYCGLVNEEFIRKNNKKKGCIFKECGLRTLD